VFFKAIVEIRSENICLKFARPTKCISGRYWFQSVNEYAKPITEGIKKNKLNNSRAGNEKRG
jgi:hypothetical protein